MNIEHLAIWVNDLDATHNFYTSFFGAKASAKYHDPKNNLTSYFQSFAEGTRLELMTNPKILSAVVAGSERLGLAHFAISLGSKGAVDALTENLRKNGFTIVGESRTTGDGCYESVISDPESDQIELTV